MAHLETDMSRIIFAAFAVCLMGCTDARHRSPDDAFASPSGRRVAESPPQAAPRPTFCPREGYFDSSFRLRVFAVRETSAGVAPPIAVAKPGWFGRCECIGQTPTPDGSGLAVPASGQWYVAPVDPGLSNEDFAALAAELKRQAVPGLSMNGCSKVDDLEPLLGFTSLKMLRLPAAELEGYEVHKGDSLVGLEAFAIPDANLIHDSDWFFLKDLPRLASLEIGICWEFTDEDAKWLSESTQPSTLRVSCCKHMVDADIARLAGLPHLTELYLHDCPRITDAGVRALAKLPRLKMMYLQCRGVTGTCFDEPDGYPSLEIVSFFPTGHCASSTPTDAALVGLGRIRGLRELHLFCSTEITDAGLAHLADSSKLEVLTLAGCDQVTDKGISHLTGLEKLTRLDLMGTKVTDRGLAGLAATRSLRHLDLSSATISEDGLELILNMKHLQSLALGRPTADPAAFAKLSTLPELRALKLARLTDAHLEALAGLTRLTDLELSDCERISDAGLEHLSSMVNLRELGLENCKQVSDAGLAHLAGLAELRGLAMTGSRIKGPGLAHLDRMRNLRTLILGHPTEDGTLSDEGLCHLARLTSLNRLDVEGCSAITDGGVSKLASLANLSELNLHGCRRISNASLATLKQLPLLTKVGIFDTDVDKAGLEEISRAIPGLQLNCSISLSTE
jgi:Leucine-rich repeat (LRR) protein